MLGFTEGRQSGGAWGPVETADHLHCQSLIYKSDSTYRHHLGLYVAFHVNQAKHPIWQLTLLSHFSKQVTSFMEITFNKQGRI